MATSDRVEPQRLVKRRSPRGQAMVEYSVITHFILIGGTLLLLPVVSELMNAISTFYESVYTVIETAAI